MTGNANFPQPPVSSAEYTATLDNYEDKLAKKATADIIAFTIARHQLEEVSARIMVV